MNKHDLRATDARASSCPLASAAVASRRAPTRLASSFVLSSSVSGRAAGIFEGISEFSPEAQGLEEQLFAIDDEVESLLVLDRWLCSLVRQPVDPQVSLAVQLVEHVAARPELLTAEALVRASGLSMRPLQKLFRSHVGASPKWVIRRFRLQEAALRLERGESRSIAELAAELGYSDHGHLTRDFKAATGRSPSEFARDVHR